MHNFSYARAADIDGALRLVAQPGAQFIAGGTNLLDLMKGGIAIPERLVDITQIAGLAQIHQLPAGAIRIGALASNSDTAKHSLIRERHPLLAQAIESGASAQLRNMATVGGNILQRTRCGYFYDTAFDECNKRNPGSGCAAIRGYNRNHAVLGASESCIATHPSDMCVALVALDAVVQLRTARGARAVPLADFQRLPGDAPQTDSLLAPGEIITAVDLPSDRWLKHSAYLKVRDRASYAFALVSVAAAIDIQDEVMQDARVVLGGVAHKPWQVPEAASLLRGRRADTNAFREVAEAAFQGAAPRKHNAFKIELGKRAVIRGLSLAASAGANLT
ncbi:MAG TPA: xanthine dehydrogenase family protein subunit M [Steroidobacteraceae bacterium]|nr:xanthine dehydrogenase family protein subunit M [Steroidobacteraceae bacterium]